MRGDSRFRRFARRRSRRSRPSHRLTWGPGRAAPAYAKRSPAGEDILNLPPSSRTDPPARPQPRAYPQIPAALRKSSAHPLAPLPQAPAPARVPRILPTWRCAVAPTKPAPRITASKYRASRRAFHRPTFGRRGRAGPTNERNHDPPQPNPHRRSPNPRPSLILRPLAPSFVAPSRCRFVAAAEGTHRSHRPRSTTSRRARACRFHCHSRARAPAEQTHCGPPAAPAVSMVEEVPGASASRLSRRSSCDSAASVVHAL